MVLWLCKKGIRRYQGKFDIFSKDLLPFLNPLHCIAAVFSTSKSIADMPTLFITRTWFKKQTFYFKNISKLKTDETIYKSKLGMLDVAESCQMSSQAVRCRRKLSDVVVSCQMSSLAVRLCLLLIKQTQLKWRENLMDDGT
jgi:hypothetical protein